MRITESDNIMKSVSGGLEMFGEYNDLAILLGESDGFAEEFAKKENLTFSEVHIHIRKIVVGDMNRPVKEKHGIVVVRFVDDKSGRYISDRISKVVSDNMFITLSYRAYWAQRYMLYLFTNGLADFFDIQYNAITDVTIIKN